MKNVDFTLLHVVCTQNMMPDGSLSALNAPCQIDGEHSHVLMDIAGAQIAENQKPNQSICAADCGVLNFAGILVFSYVAHLVLLHGCALKG
jgi:hypothetical protein